VPVTSGDLEGVARRQGIEVGAGDAVLVHTGWSELWEHEPERYAAAEPGLDADAADWLARHRVSPACRGGGCGRMESPENNLHGFRRDCSPHAPLP
jgi:putative cyclase